MDAFVHQFVRNFNDRRSRLTQSTLFANNPFNTYDRSNGNSLQGDTRFHLLQTSDTDILTKNDPDRSLDAQIADETKKQAIAEGKTPLDDKLEDRLHGFDDIGTFHKGLALGLQAVAKEDVDISEKDKPLDAVNIVVDIVPLGTFKYIGITQPSEDERKVSFDNRVDAEYNKQIKRGAQGELRSFNAHSTVEGQIRAEEKQADLDLNNEKLQVSKHKKAIIAKLEENSKKNNGIHLSENGENIDVNGKEFRWNYDPTSEAQAFHLTIPTNPTQTSFTAVFTEAGALLGMYPRLEDLSAMFGIKGRARHYNLGRRVAGFISPQGRRRVMYLDRRGYRRMLDKHFPDHKDPKKPAEMSQQDIDDSTSKIDRATETQRRSDEEFKEAHG